MEFETNAAVVEDLIETLEDGRKGFDQAADKIANDDRADLATKFRELSAERARFSAQLREWAGSKSVEIREEGSIGGAMHRGWISLKDALTGDSAEAVVEAVKTGEKHAVTEYEDALEKDLDASLRQIVEMQATSVRGSLGQMDTLSVG
jgi:uncharacterized protein (TIGR02284 family)